MFNYQDRKITIEEIERTNVDGKYKGFGIGNRANIFTIYKEHGYNDRQTIFDISCGYGDLQSPFLETNKAVENILEVN